METTTEVIITPAPSLRPTFLTVLCILTFIGSGWGVYKGFSGYFTADMSAQIVSQAQDKINDQMADNTQPAFLKNMMGGMFSSMSADNIRKSSIISLVSCLLTLIGAVMMWQLRKAGFYLYIAGILISVVMPIALFGGGLIGLMAGGISAFIGIIFIILYGVNMKYMVR
jgi:type III secretory pathway component EscR